MTHVNLDRLDAAVRQFLLDIALDPDGSVIETNGEAVAWLVPAPPASDDGNWSDEKNARRGELIDRKYCSGISPDEAVELARLQDQMLRYRQLVAPLPLEDARRLHQDC